MKSDLEPPLRFAVGYANSAVEYLGRMEPNEHLDKAVKAFEKAKKHIRAYAAEREIVLRSSMKT